MNWLQYQNKQICLLTQFSATVLLHVYFSKYLTMQYAKKSVKATADSCPDSCPVDRKIARASMYNAHQCSGRGLLHVHWFGKKLRVYCGFTQKPALQMIHPTFLLIHYYYRLSSLTSISKKPGQTIVLYHYCVCPDFFETDVT